MKKFWKLLLVPEERRRGVFYQRAVALSQLSLKVGKSHASVRFDCDANAFGKRAGFLKEES